MPVLNPDPPDLRILGDVEFLCVEWLKAHPAVVAEVGQRVWTSLPKEPSFPALRLFRVGGAPTIEQHLDVARIQVESFALSKYDARFVAATAQAALHVMVGVHDQGVVTAVEDAIGPIWAPDPPTNRPRYHFDVFVYLHPSPI
jgi:hypothetical protein